MTYMKYSRTKRIIADRTKVQTEFSFTQNQSEILSMFFFFEQKDTGLKRKN